MPGTRSIRMRSIYPPGTQSDFPWTWCLDARSVGVDEHFASVSSLRPSISLSANLFIPGDGDACSARTAGDSVHVLHRGILYLLRNHSKKAMERANLLQQNLQHCFLSRGFWVATHEHSTCLAKRIIESICLFPKLLLLWNLARNFPAGHFAVRKFNLRPRRFSLAK